ncbi:MAG TPA: glycosyltransferase family 4 protein [Candidatus Baltobacteraceae bacterium]|nr:glycosyltransferase family 4 protein [Candidatus Baltobacteraceae bacterium]
MKIAYVTSQYPYGTNEAFLAAELATLARYARDIVVVPVRPRSREPLQETFGLDVDLLPPFSSHVALLALGEVLRSPAEVMRMLRAIVSRRYGPRAKLKNLALFPKALAVTAVLRRRRVDHIHAHWLSTPSTVAYVASELTGIPWSCTAHRFDIFEDNLLREKAQSARFIRTISERNREIVVQKAGDALNGRCLVLHLGVSVPPAAASVRGEGQLRILCPAHFVPVKGHKYLLDALALLREQRIPFECDLAGDGPLRRQIETRIRELRLERFVHLRGTIDHDRLCADLANGRYDVAVLASTEEGNEFEGIPVSLMEAMAAGVCCVATRTGSITELIDGDCSHLIAQRDPAALANALTALYRDGRARAETGRAARRRIEGAFDASVTSRQLFDLMSAP